MPARRMNIGEKMLLGYLPLVFFMLVLSGFSLFHLNRLDRLSRAITDSDVPLQEAAKEMKDQVLAEELYRRRYMILPNPEPLRLFWARSAEIEDFLRRMSSLPGGSELSLHRIQKLHDEYLDLVAESLRPEGSGGSAQVAIDKQIVEKHGDLLGVIETLSASIARGQQRKLQDLSRLGSDTFRWMTLLCAIGILAGVAGTLLVYRPITRSIRRLQAAVRFISAGDFSRHPEVETADELGELAEAFREMAGHLKRLEADRLDANSLTRLPGPIAIQDAVEKRIASEVPFVFCLVDLDDFKAYNDRYGYARGSGVIAAAARMIERVVSRLGEQDDFIGHIGGDDFVLITIPDRYEALCRGIIREFESAAGGFYDPEDKARGFIIGKTRQGGKMKFPLMTVSVAVVDSTSHHPASPVEVGEIAARLKDCAKSLPGSNIVTDMLPEGPPSCRPEANGENNVVSLPIRPVKS